MTTNPNTNPNVNQGTFFSGTSSLRSLLRNNVPLFLIFLMLAVVAAFTITRTGKECDALPDNVVIYVSDQFLYYMDAIFPGFGERKIGKRIENVVLEEFYKRKKIFFLTLCFTRKSFREFIESKDRDPSDEEKNYYFSLEDIFVDDDFIYYGVEFRVDQKSLDQYGYFDAYECIVQFHCKVEAIHEVDKGYYTTVLSVLPQKVDPTR